MKPNVAILKAEGTNFDEETFEAFNLAHANAKILLMSEVLKKPSVLSGFEILDIPGGFSYGDDLYSGKIWANELNSHLKYALAGFIKRGGLIIGVCNGFQVLVRCGILPGFGTLNETIGLIYNQKNKFECRWVNIKLQDNRCVFLNGQTLEGMLPVEHGEGRFIVKDDAVAKKLRDNQQIVFQYCDSLGAPTQTYPFNPNGSVQAIAGICDTSGQVFGMMPHPEHFMYDYQYPNWRREKKEPFGIKIYENAVAFLKRN